MAQTILTVATRGQGLYEFTAEAGAFVRGAGMREGLLTVFVRHTSCSLLVQENADPDVRRDLDQFLRRLVPPADDPSMAGSFTPTRGRTTCPPISRRR
jgi:secondary thiamine-phosphate synthase enzyme